MEDGLLRIGLFSRLTQISVRMLRHYQDQGLLEPAAVDPFTGYRYFEPQQIATARLIQSVRAAGFSIEQTGQLLAARDDSALLASLLEDQSRRLEAEREEFAGRVLALANVSAILKEKPMVHDIHTTTLPAMTVAQLRRTIPTYMDEGTLWQEIMPLAIGAGVAFPAGGIAGATFYDPEYRETDPDVAIWMQVAGEFVSAAPLECVAVPSQEIVYVTLVGSYEQMDSVSAAIGEYLGARQLAVGPMFNIYRVGPATEPDPTKWVTDVCFPLL